MDRLIMWSFLILPWLSLWLMKGSTLRRYMPVALLATVFNTIVYQIAWASKWWVYKETLFYWDKVQQVHTVYGAFFVGTMWIFRFTYRKFWVYLAVNLAVDTIYAYGLRALWKSIGITSGGKLPPYGSVAIMTVMGLLLYAYQLWQERIFVPQPESGKPRKKVVNITWVSASIKQFKQRAR